mmetsp:Transcript_93851/g.271252  ORF Transcript_93851/g.271252 Transcript_93851/m.271252 type:complete len:400 (+) Transcript_93851:64-1263(+)
MAPALRSIFVVAAGVAVSRGVAQGDAGGTCDTTAQGRGQCGSKAPQADHLMLQIKQHTVVSAPGGFGDNACPGMPDVKQTCGSNGCRVLAKVQHRSCTEYCQLTYRSCVGAWEEVSDNCDVKYAWRCDDRLPGTSDLLCECSAETSGGGSIADPSGLRLVWQDDFDGNAVDRSKWDFVHGGGGFGNQELQYYSQNNAVVQGGSLRISARCQDYHGEKFTSAKISTHGFAEWGPGHRVEVRARMPRGKGTWPAIWMLPADSEYGQWPHSGEIDIMEAVGCTKDTIYGTVHTGRYNHMKHTEKFNKMRLAIGDWHTYAIVWEDQEIRWYVDGQEYHRFHPSAFDSERWPFGKRFYLILNLAVGGSWGGFCLNHAPPSCHKADEFGQEQVMEVDYARVYSLH